MLLIIQTFTYIYIGPKLLKTRILPKYFQDSEFHSDSLLVKDCDFVIQVLDKNFHTYYHNLNLRNNPNFFKQQFSVKQVEFENALAENKDNTIYKMEYEIIAKSGDISSLFNFYSCGMDEFLVNENRRFISHRYTRYRWFLFTWIQTFELLESWENKHE
jgi:hypothetical protein